jgi:hypothetical protein
VGRARCFLEPHPALFVAEVGGDLRPWAQQRHGTDVLLQAFVFAPEVADLHLATPADLCDHLDLDDRLVDEVAVRTAAAQQPLLPLREQLCRCATDEGRNK